MAYSRIFIIELHPNVLFSPKGSVKRWNTIVSQQVERAVRSEAPVRSGDLKASIDKHQFSSQARLTAGFEITMLDRAKYVIEGTPTITTDRELGFFLPAIRIPSHPKSRSRYQGFSFRAVGIIDPKTGEEIPGPQEVAGQDSNDFVARGYNRVAARHRALGRFNEL